MCQIILIIIINSPFLFMNYNKQIIIQVFSNNLMEHKFRKEIKNKILDMLSNNCSLNHNFCFETCIFHGNV